MNRFLRKGMICFMVGLSFMLGSFMSFSQETEFTKSEVQQAVQKYVSEKAHDGKFLFHDPISNQDLSLIFEKVRIVRSLAGYGYFATTQFHDSTDPSKPYELDFWWKPKGNELLLMDIRIYKFPKKEGDRWVLQTHYPIAWWWLPSTEHPGEYEQKRAWEVKAAIHDYVAQKMKEGGGVFHLKDPKTGKDLALEFVEIHNPVRRIPGKQYFACTDFREKGEPEKYYDIDFWFDEKQGKLIVSDIKIHKEPVKEGEQWIQVERYSFEKDHPQTVP
ncbi:hypothetical protein [Candidatus Methylacidiphilum infernorum]|nr:hypothetical protein [Candidatus Methylacidiphilum infernorum]